MGNDGTVVVLTVVIAISAGLLTWFAVDVGIQAVSSYRTKFTERTNFQVQEFFLFIDAKKLFVANLAVMTSGGGITWIVTGAFWLSIPAFLGLALAPRFLYALMRKRRRHKFEGQLPDALMMLSGGMRAGVGLNSAMGQLVAEAPAPLSQEFSLILREQKLGVTLEQSLNNLARRMPTQTTTLVVSAMRIASETGGGLAETLERTAATIRSRLQMEGKIGALTAQGKLQAWVVGLLPVILMLILHHMEPDAMSLLWHSPIGWAVLAALAVLEFLGVYVIRKIIAIDV